MSAGHSGAGTARLDRVQWLRRGLASMTATKFGVLAGVVAVGLEAFFTVRPPSAYGVCIACHGRDLVGWMTNRIAPGAIDIAEVSLVFPLLTVVGVVLGAALAAWRNGEFRWHRPAAVPQSLALGFLTMIFALLVAGCALRLTLRAAYGEPLAILAVAVMAAGIVGTTVLMKWWVLR